MPRFKVSYVKKKFAARSMIAVTLEAVALLFMVLGFAISVQNQGGGGLNAAALGFCSLLLAIVGMWYGLLSFSEKEKNYLLARISLIAGGVFVVVWLTVILIGFGG